MLSRIKSTFMVIAIAAAFISIIWVPSTSAASPPVTTVDISQPNYTTSLMYVNSITNFTLTSVDANGTSISNIWYSWNSDNYTEYTGAFNPIVMQQTTGGVPALPIELVGPNTLYYNATDDQGNVESPKSIQVFVDDAVPSSSIEYVGDHYNGNYNYLTPDTKMTLSASDAGSGLDKIYYSIDDGQGLEYSAAFNITDAGLHTIDFYAIDNLGNQESEEQVSVYVDNSGPTVNIVPGSPTYTLSGTVYVTSESRFSITADAESSISSIKYSIDSGEWLSYSTPFLITVEASHAIKYYATDNLGQDSLERSVNLVVDDSPPTIFTSLTGDGNIELESDTLFYINCTDAQNGVGTCYAYYSLDDGLSWVTYYEPILIKEDMDITFYAEDILGNAAPETTYSFDVVSPPSQISETAYMFLGSGLITVGLVITYFIITRGDGEAKTKPEKQKDEDLSSKPKKKLKKRN